MMTGRTDWWVQAPSCKIQEKKNQGNFGFSLKLAKRHEFHRSIEKSIERKKWCGINRKQPEV